MGTARGLWVVLVGVVLWLFAGTAEAQMQPGGAVMKLGRGLANVFTGWVEIPKRIYETSQLQGTAAGVTWGLLRGLGYGFIRTAAGVYETFTFPFPAPPNYAPVISPEYVFLENGPPVASESGRR